MKNRLRHQLVSILRRPWFWILAILLVARLAHARRPGGGGSFSGGGGGSSDDGGIELVIDLIILLVELCVDYPEIGIPVLAVAVVGVVIWRAGTAHGATRFIVGIVGLGMAGAGIAFVPNFLWAVLGLAIVGVILYLIGRSSSKPSSGWQTTTKTRTTPVLAPVVTKSSSPTALAAFKALEKDDPDFSRVLLRDFLYALYSEVQAARGAQKLARLAPYVDDKARAALTDAKLTAVNDVIVGGMQIVKGTIEEKTISLEIAFQVNLTETTAAGSQAFYLEQSWLIERQRSARSRPPARVRAFDCPNCGAPLSADGPKICSHCSQVIDSGQFDWIVRWAITQNVHARPPILTEDTQEAGNELPTLVDPDFSSLRHIIKTRGFVENTFRTRVRQIFDVYQVAWREQKDDQLKPFVSERYFDVQHRWVLAYRAAGLRNMTSDASILNMQLVRVTCDRYFDAITVRIFASSLDYTVKTSDLSLVCGSKSKPRAYTEYWTLVRSAEQSAADTKCPNCGAPVVINMAGQCSHCQAKLEMGQFDWVLSEIEQDEVYAGS